MNGRRESRSRGRGGPRGGSRGRHVSGGVARPGAQGKGGDQITFSVCKYYITGTCARGDSCKHSHIVERVSEAQVSLRRSDGTRGAIRSVVQWRDKPDHIFTACDDGFVKMWSTTDGSNWQQVSSINLHDWHHIGALQEVDGSLYVGYGRPYVHAPDVTVDALRVVDLKQSTVQEVVNPSLGFAHATRINCLAVVAPAAGEARVYTGDENGRIVAWARPAPGSPFAQLGVLDGHARAIRGLVFARENGMLWSASEDSTIRVWNLGSNACEHIINRDNGGHSGGVVALALGQSAAEGSPKDYVITASTDGTMGVFKTSDGTVTYKHKCGEGVTALAVFDPRPGASALLLVGYQDGTIALRNFPEFALAFQLHPDSTHVGHRKAVLALLPINNPSIEDSFFLSAGEEGSLICWKVHNLTDDRPSAGS